MERQEQIASVPVLETLGLLPDPDRRFSSFCESLVLNGVIAILLFCFATARLHQALPAPRYTETELIFAKRLPPPVARIKLSPPRPITELPRKIKLPTPPQLPQPEIVHLKPAAVPAIPAAPAKSVVAAPQPKVGLFASSKAPAVANNRSQSAVKSGGFGDPSGVTPNPNAARPATIAAVGSFNNTPGFTQGAGSSQAGRRTVASAGFGDGVAGGTPGGVGAGQGTVATGGFGSNVIGGSVTPRAVPRQPSFTPPQVLSEPHPQYTQEARQLRIQGEVTLQVCFGMDGKVQVLRIVSGLGHGLDEAATLVAEQIQFKPATKDGQPTNHITMIHILFQLA